MDTSLQDYAGLKTQDFSDSFALTQRKLNTELCVPPPSYKTKQCKITELGNKKAVQKGSPERKKYIHEREDKY